MIVSGWGLILLNNVFEIGDIISIISVLGSSSSFELKVEYLWIFCK